jgi:cytoskeletal protein CcmA (bactofilin family)
MAKETAANNGTAHSVLAAGSRVKGDVYSDGDFRVDGAVEGKIQCAGRLVIGQKGFVQGDVTCENADILGALTGNIVVRDTLSLKSTAVVNGDIRIKTLIIEPEAVFCGTCSMGQKEEQTSAED